mmetsp:Transcript_12898/g.32506  ORF Transcript_12898/g.32506 Transcript_12898/m.32506 type:complete len:298 (-) Transcript_12898:751-1644(-)
MKADPLVGSSCPIVDNKSVSSCAVRKRCPCTSHDSIFLCPLGRVANVGDRHLCSREFFGWRRCGKRICLVCRQTDGYIFPSPRVFDARKNVRITPFEGDGKIMLSHFVARRQEPIGGTVSRRRPDRNERQKQGSLIINHGGSFSDGRHETFRNRALENKLGCVYGFDVLVSLLCEGSFAAFALGNIVVIKVELRQGFLTVGKAANKPSLHPIGIRIFVRGQSIPSLLSRYSFQWNVLKERNLGLHLFQNIKLVRCRPRLAPAFVLGHELYEFSVVGWEDVVNPGKKGIRVGKVVNGP